MLGAAMEFINIPESAQCLIAALENNYILINSATLFAHKSYKEGGGASGPIEDVLMGTGTLHMMQPFWGYLLTIRTSVTAGIFTI